MLLPSARRSRFIWTPVCHCWPAFWHAVINEYWLIDWLTFGIDKIIIIIIITQRCYICCAARHQQITLLSRLLTAIWGLPLVKSQILLCLIFAGYKLLCQLHTTAWGAKGVIARNSCDNLHRIKFPLRSIFFQKNSFFVGNRMDTVKKTRAIILQRFDTSMPMRIEDFPKSVVPRNFNTFLITRTQIPSFRAIPQRRKAVRLY